MKPVYGFGMTPDRAVVERTRKDATRRRRMKRWLRSRGINYSTFQGSSEAALRKLVREHA
jgi:hypothetical protein